MYDVNGRGWCGSINLLFRFIRNSRFNTYIKYRPDSDELIITDIDSGGSRMMNVYEYRYGVQSASGFQPDAGPKHLVIKKNNNKK
jgi:hypothetical protein